MRRYSNLEHLTPVLDRCLAARDADHVERPPLPGPRLIKDKLSDDDRDAIVEAYTAKRVSLAALADEYGVSDYSIRKVLRRAGVRPRRSTLPGQVLDEIHRLRSANMPIAQIAIRCQVPEASVRLIVASAPSG